MYTGQMMNDLFENVERAELNAKAKRAEGQSAEIAKSPLWKALIYQVLERDNYGAA